MKQAAPKGAAIILGVINIKHICLFESYPDMLTVDNLMEALQIKDTTAYTMIRKGEIKSFKIGKSIRIPKIWLIEYIDNLCYNTDMEQELSIHQESEVLKHDDGQLTA